MNKTKIAIYTSLFVFIYLLCACTQTQGQVKSKAFQFSFEGRKYSGLIDIPSVTPKSLIVLIPGSGPTNMLGGDEYFKNLREFFLQIGLSVTVYDKQAAVKVKGLLTIISPFKIVVKKSCLLSMSLES